MERFDIHCEGVAIITRDANRFIMAKHLAMSGPSTKYRVKRPAAGLWFGLVLVVVLLDLNRNWNNDKCISFTFLLAWRAGLLIALWSAPPRQGSYFIITEFSSVIRCDGGMRTSVLTMFIHEPSGHAV